MATCRQQVFVCLATLIFGSTLLAQNAKSQATVAKGDVLKFAFNKSKIFPGTVRDYWVYVPKQYKPETPACVYVNQDGLQYKANEVFDRLIASGEMPVVIGVFVMHGKVPAPSNQALDRFNRSYEYDGMGSNYVRFLLEELLPEVETKSTPDGRAIKLSKRGTDRCIGGGSSGAICAFTAAWERPEEFSRVFSSIGTYVGLRGGQNYSTLVRKFEPKPIRIFLEDGSNDLNIYGGDWWIANQAMQRSFKFAGYEVNHVWGEGGHNGEHATKVFPDAMRYLWKDWPNPPKSGLGSPQLQEILIPGEDWKLVGSGYQFTEGPAAHPNGEIYFNDVPKSKTYKVGLDGKVSEFLADSKNGNGQMVRMDGKLVAVAGGAKSIMVYDGQGNGTIFAREIAGNDIAVKSDGSCYVTAPGPGNKSGDVFYVSPAGEVKQVDSGLKFANGVTFSPDQTLLYVADYRSHWVYSYQVSADGTLKHKQKYYHLHVPDDADDSGADGIRCDQQGRLYVATRMGIQVCDQAGRVNAIIPVPAKVVSNICFGGPEFNILFATCGDRVFMRKVKVKGACSFQPPIKPAPPRL